MDGGCSKSAPFQPKHPSEHLNHIMVRLNIGLLLTQKALEAIGLTGWCGN